MRTTRSSATSSSRLGKMMEDIRHGKDPNEAYEKNMGTYGRFTAEAGRCQVHRPA